MRNFHIYDICWHLLQDRIWRRCAGGDSTGDEILRPYKLERLLGCQSTYSTIHPMGNQGKANSAIFKTSVFQCQDCHHPAESERWKVVSAFICGAILGVRSPSSDANLNDNLNVVRKACFDTPHFSPGNLHSQSVMASQFTLPVIRFYWKFPSSPKWIWQSHKIDLSFLSWSHILDPHA